MNGTSERGEKLALWHPYDFALRCTQKFIKHINWNVYRWQVVGEIRRGKESVRSIEIVIVPRQKRLDIMKRILRRECKGLDDARKNVWTMTFERIPVVVYVATKENFRALEFLRTGPQDFVRQFLTVAETKGYSLGEDGFRRGSKTIIPVSESSIFRTVCFPYVKPDQRYELKHIPSVSL